MRKTLVIGLISMFIISESAMAGLGLFDKRPVIEQQQEIDQQSKTMLWDLYKVQPNARDSVKNAYGYATFSNFGMKIFVAGGGGGRGIAINNQTGDRTYMKMAEIQAGLGMGVKKFKLVWVFETESAFNSFVHSGWKLGAQATAAAKYDDAGGSFQGALSVSPGVWLYQLTDAGLALELTAKGTKYFKDKKLNNE